MSYKFSWLDQISYEKAVVSTPEVRQLLAHLWPWSEPFFHPLPHAFSAQIMNPEVFSKAPRWLLRDGIYPLAAFFSRNPAPTSPTQLVISSQLARLVPPAWAGQVSYHSVYKTTKRPAKKPTKLLVSCMLNPFITTLEDIKSRVEAFCSEHGNDFTEILLFAPVRLWQGSTDEAYPAAAALQLFEAFSKKIRPVNWRYLQTVTDYSDYLFFELTPPKLFTVSFFAHFLASRQAYCADWGSIEDQEVKAKENESVALSKFHGVLITKEPTKFAKPVTEEEIMGTMFSDLTQAIDWLALYGDMPEAGAKTATAATETAKRPGRDIRAN